MFFSPITLMASYTVSVEDTEKICFPFWFRIWFTVIVLVVLVKAKVTQNFYTTANNLLTIGRYLRHNQ